MVTELYHIVPKKSIFTAPYSSKRSEVVKISIINSMKNTSYYELFDHKAITQINVKTVVKLTLSIVVFTSFTVDCFKLQLHLILKIYQLTEFKFSAS